MSCPVSRVEEPGSGVEGGAPKAASEMLGTKKTTRNSRPTRNGVLPWEHQPFSSKKGT